MVLVTFLKMNFETQGESHRGCECLSSEKAAGGQRKGGSGDTEGCVSACTEGGGRGPAVRKIGF